MRVDGRVELRNIGTEQGQLVTSSLNKSRSPVDGLAFSSDSRFLAVYYRAKIIMIWSVEANRQQTHIQTAPDYVVEMAFADGHRTLVTMCARSSENEPAGHWNQSVMRWDVATGKKRDVHAFDPGLLFKAMSPDGRFAVMQQDDVGQTVFDLITGRKAFAIDSNGTFAFSNDASILVSCSGKQVAVWAVPSGRELRRIAFDRNYDPPGYSCGEHLSLSPEGKMLAVSPFGQSNIVGLIDLRSGRVLDKIECAPELMFCDVVCFSPVGRTLATNTSDVNRNDREVKPLLRFWNIPAW
jgi:WD40 repeat protein